MSSWLRRLSRDRSSKLEPSDFQPPEYNVRDRPPTAYSEPRQQTAGATKDSQYPTTPDMLRRQQQSQPSAPQPMADQRQYASSTYRDQPSLHNGSSDNSPINSHGGRASGLPAPDALTRAFNEALKPFTDKLSLLQADLDAANAQVHALEAEKAALHNWIDKRGLRPDLPSDLSASLVTQSPVAASTLSTQLDRKMTMLNFSLHQLADSLPGPIPTSTVTSTLAALLPKIQYLGSLPAGAPSAFESLIKLAGNLNSHHSGEETDVDRATIAEFYNELDDIMLGVVGQRLQDGEEDWDAGRDVRRLDKTASFLRKEMGVRNYFLRSLDVMRNESRVAAAAGGVTEGMPRYSDQESR